MKTTYIKIYAGLGNQLFQYCYGLYLQAQGIKETRGRNIRYVLSETVKNGVCNDLPAVFTLYDLNGNKCSNIIAPSGPFKQLKLNLLKIWAKYAVRSYETGFYQKAEYIEKIESVARVSKFLHFTREEIYRETDPFRQISEKKTSVSIHIRGGDYLTAAGTYGGICTPEYYRNAISYMLEKEPDAHFFVFSNDRNYCRKIMSAVSIPDSKWSFIVDEESLKNDVGYDLYLMTQCRHNIIANSTYSWWGAYLNCHEGKIVITPSKWTNDGTPSLEEIKPSAWISL